jgi:plastocyanin
MKYNKFLADYTIYLALSFLAIIFAYNFAFYVVQSSPEISTKGKAFAQRKTSALVNVTISSSTFIDQPVTINQGDSVKWTNNDTTQHSIVFENNVFNPSPMLGQGGTFTHVFNTPGIFNYYCSPHTAMTGTIIVNALPTPTPTPINTPTPTKVVKTPTSIKATATPTKTLTPTTNTNQVNTTQTPSPALTVTPSESLVKALTKTVTVKVTDISGKPIQGAAVTLNSKTVLTDSSGLAEFMEIEEGQHKAVVEYENKKFEKNVNLSPGIDQELEVKVQNNTSKAPNRNPAFLIVSLVMVLISAACLGIFLYLYKVRKSTDSNFKEEGDY